MATNCDVVIIRDAIIAVGAAKAADPTLEGILAAKAAPTNQQIHQAHSIYDPASTN